MTLALIVYRAAGLAENFAFWLICGALAIIATLVFCWGDMGP